MKLFQIPIYAFEKNTLKQRILKWKMNNYPTNPAFADSIHYMQKNYEYNHIVGYIELGILSNDIYGHLYLPYIPIRTSTSNVYVMKLEYNLFFCSKKKRNTYSHCQVTKLSNLIFPTIAKPRLERIQWLPLISVSIPYHQPTLVSL